jgi:hypothetical protein
VLALLLVGASVALAVKLLGTGGGGQPAPAPSTFATYNVKDGAFQITYPEGWDKEAAGASGHAWAKFTGGDASIKIKESTLGSLIGGGDSGGGHDRGQEDKYFGAQSLHETKKAFYAEEMSGYTEESGEGFTTKFGLAWRTPFTFATTFGGKFRGIRATYLGAVKQVDVICICPARDWETLRPVFIKCLDSVSLGIRE